MKKRPHETKFKRRVGSPAFRRVVLLPNGTLAMKDGSDLATYMRQFRRYQGMRGAVEVSVIPVDSLEHLEADALLARHWPA